MSCVPVCVCLRVKDEVRLHERLPCCAFASVRVCVCVNGKQGWLRSCTRLTNTVRMSVCVHVCRYACMCLCSLPACARAWSTNSRSQARCAAVLGSISGYACAHACAAGG